MAKGGVVHIKWYATGFRGDDLEVALGQIGAFSLRYGATRYDVFRSRDDRYNFVFSTEWDSKDDWDAYWYGEEFTEMRAACSGWYQIPLLYVWQDKTAFGEFRADNGNGGNGNGHTAPAPEAETTA